MTSSCYNNWAEIPCNRCQSFLTHWGRDKMADISQRTFSHEFSWMKIYSFPLKFHWNLFPMDPINNIQALIWIMAGCRSGDEPLSEAMMVRSLTHICATVKTQSCQKPQKFITWFIVFILCFLFQSMIVVHHIMTECAAEAHLFMSLCRWMLLNRAIYCYTFMASRELFTTMRPYLS